MMNQRREKPPHTQKIDGSATVTASQGSDPPASLLNQGYNIQQVPSTGIPYSAMPWDMVNASCFAIPPSYGRYSKCSECFNLTCELARTRQLLQDSNSKLVVKGSELSHYFSEVEYLRKRNEKLEEELRNRNEKLEQELKQCRENCAHFKERCNDLERSLKLLEQERDELKSAKREVFGNQINISPPVTNKCYDDLTDTCNSPWNQDSSSKPHSTRDRDIVGQPPQSRKHENDSRRATDGAASQKHVYESEQWNSSEVRPSKHQNRSVHAEEIPAKIVQNDAGTSETQQNRHGTLEGDGNKLGQSKDIRSAGNQHRGGRFSESHHGGTNVHISRAPRTNRFDGDQGASGGPPSRGPQNSRPSVEKPLHSSCVKEIRCDLFKMPPEYALAHCVGSDFIMSSGVAVQFRKTFRSIPELLDQNKKPGEVAFIEKSLRKVYYLVTKPVSTVKPKWEDFERSVVEWRNLCVEHEIKKIAIPKIGCGRDQLDWNRVQMLLNLQFSDTGIEITVCVIDEESAPEKKWNLKLCHSKEPLSDLDPRDCALLFVGSKDGFMTDQIDKLASKFGFTSDFRNQNHGIGSLYHYDNKARKVNVFGLIVKEKHTDPISFCNIAKCFQGLKRVMKNLNLWYIGIEAFDDPKYDIVMRKIWTVVIDTFYVDEFEVYFCWPGNTKEKCWEEIK